MMEKYLKIQMKTGKEKNEKTERERWGEIETETEMGRDIE